VESQVGSDRPNGTLDGNIAEASSEDACYDTPVQPINAPEMKFQRELKPPRVLEVLIFNLIIWSVIPRMVNVLCLHSLFDSYLYSYLQALSASGLRALRYAREIEGIGQVVALDNDKGT